MGRRGYPAEFRRRVLDLLAQGRSVASVAHDLEISDQTIYSWRRQDRIDRGLQPGLSTAENAELAKAKKRIAELETELEISRRASHASRATPGHGADSSPGHTGVVTVEPAKALATSAPPDIELTCTSTPTASASQW
jgi:transposase-like protein